MADRPTHKTSEGKISHLQSEHGCFVGLQPECSGIVSFSGIYFTFIILFKANGDIWVINLEDDKKLIMARVEEGATEEVSNLDKTL